MTYDYNDWLKNGQPKIFCKCGCGEEIIIKKNHKYYYEYYGIPEYIQCHWNKSRCGENHPLYGKISPFFNHKHTEESKQKNREKHLGKLIGNNNPMKRPEVKIKFSGDLSPSKRPEVREKIRLSKLGNKNPAWNNGSSFNPYCYKFNNKLKEEIRKRDNNICQNCGKTEEKNGRKLDVHHIHYDKENCYPDLITLCNSCNIKANFNRDYCEKHYVEKLKERNLLNYFGDIK